MPNGGSDNCETCWFNSRHEGKAGEGDGLPCRCVIRGENIVETYFTYCANHPHHNPGRVRLPVGPIYAAGGTDLSHGHRVVFKPSPDSAEVREGLVALLEALPETPEKEYPSPTRFEWEVIRQLGAFKEKRALPGLRRVLKLAPLGRARAHEGHQGEVVMAGEMILDRQGSIGLALEALAKILGAEALPEIEPFVTTGLQKPGQPLEIYEKLAKLRLWAVRALAVCGPAAKPLLEKAAKDPVAMVAAEARSALG